MKYLNGSLILVARLIYGVFVNVLSVKILLKNLSQEYYGIYILILGGSILMFSYIQASNQTAQRFFSYNRDNKNILIEQLNSLLNYVIKLASFFLLICLLILSIYFFLSFDYELFLEILIPIILITFFTFFQVIGIPFVSLFSSLEKFKHFSISVGFDNTIKLLGAYSTSLVLEEKYKLLICSLVLFFGSILSFALKNYMSNLLKVKFNYRTLKKTNSSKKMKSFTFFSALGLISKNINDYGNNFLINNFFNSIFVSFRAVSSQLFNILNQFLGTIFLLYKSDITYNYSQKNHLKTNDLIVISSKIIFFLGVMIVFPIYINMDLVINLWLSETNEDLIFFSKLGLLASLLLALHHPLTAFVHASGNIKMYSIITESIIFFSFPLTFILYSLNFDVVYVFYVTIFCFILAHLLRIYHCNLTGLFQLKPYLKSFLIPTTLIFLFLFFIWPIKFEGILTYENKFLKIIMDSILLIPIFLIIFFRDISVYLKTYKSYN